MTLKERLYWYLWLFFAEFVVLAYACYFYAS
jgi:hypothetical protein